MTIRISENASKSEIEKKLKKVAKSKSKKGFDVKKYEGKVVRGFDGLEYQRMIRNEWS